MDYLTFQNKYLGAKINYDGVYDYQCVDLIQQYVADCYGLSGGIYGNAIDYWTSTDGKLLQKFYKVGDSQAQQGDIVVLFGLNGNQYGHIGIATGELNPGNVEILEQNGHSGNGDGEGGNRIRKRFVSRSRVAGLLRPVVVAAPVVSTPYSIDAIDAKRVVINKPTHKWNLNYDNWTAITSNPAREATQGEVVTVRAILHHHVGADYYLEDPAVASGFNVVDCNDYTPPPPSAPVTAPDTTVYDIVKPIPGYMNGTNAGNHANAVSTLDPNSTWYVYRTYPGRNDLKNVTQVLGQPGFWINEADNVVDPPPAPPAPPVEPPKPTLEEIKKNWEPVPAPVVVEAPAPTPEPANDWRESFLPANEDRSPMYFTALQDYMVKDIAGQNTDRPLKRLWRVPVAGTFIKDTTLYAKPYSKSPSAPWYGIPLSIDGVKQSIIEPEEDTFDTTTDLPTRQALKTITMSDRVKLALFAIEKLIENIINFGKGKNKH